MSISSGELPIREDLAVEFQFDPSRAEIEVHWTPRPPRRLSADELATYRQARNVFIERIARQVGGRVLVVDL